MGLSFTHAVPQCRSRHRVGVPERVPSPLAASPQGLWLWWAVWGRDQGFKIFSVCANPLPGAQSCLGTGDLGPSSQGMGGGGWRGQDPLPPSPSHGLADGGGDAQGGFGAPNPQGWQWEPIWGEMSVCHAKGEVCAGGERLGCTGWGDLGDIRGLPGDSRAPCPPREQGRVVCPGGHEGRAAPGAC